jgi:parallel beta-helix repeat protein
MRKTVSGIVVTILLISMLTLAFNVQPVKASGTIYIRADGLIDPLTAPISSVDNVTYTFTDNINGSIVVERDNITIDGNGYNVTVTSGRAIDLSDRNNVTIRNTKIEGFRTGIYLSGSYNTILHNNITVAQPGGQCIHLAGLSNNITCNIIEARCYWGITNENEDPVSHPGSDYAESNSITCNNISDGFRSAIGLVGSSNNSILFNTIINAYDDGMTLYHGLNNTITGNTIKGVTRTWTDEHGRQQTSETQGVGISCSSDCNDTITDNLIDNYKSGTGIRVECMSSFLGRNQVNNSGFGIRLWGSGNILRDNVMMNNLYNLYAPNLDRNDLDDSNLVNGKPVYRWVNRHNEEVPSEVGYVGLINCTNITLKNITLRNNGEGLLLINTNDTMMQNLTLINDFDGIVLEASRWNTICSCRIRETSDDAIALRNSHHNVISDNDIRNSTDPLWFGGWRKGITLESSNSTSIIRNNIGNNYDGIYLIWSSNNTIAANNITNNYYGIVLADSSNNMVYHNNLINNRSQISTSQSVNVWDDGYLRGGNYWEPNNEAWMDWYRGPYQNVTGSDGIVDTPYIIDQNNKDNYPLTKPIVPPKGDVNHDGKVDILDIVIIASTYGCKKGGPKWNPDADLAAPYGKIDILDLVTCIYHYGQKYP